MNDSQRARSYLGRGVAARDARRRRVLVWETLTLTLLSIAPVFAHHLEHGGGSALGHASHLGQICLVALYELLAPVHTAFHIVLLLGLAYAVYDRLVHAGRGRRVLAQLDARNCEPGDVWWRAATAAGIEPQLLRIVENLPNPAFTAGWFTSRIYVSSALAFRLTFEELTAVLGHEGAHVARRDPLRISAYRFLGCLFFWIPAFRRMADDVTDEIEILADDTAIESCAPVHPLALASALVSVATWTAEEGAITARAQTLALLVPGAVGFSGRDLLSRRVRRLAGEAAPAATHLTRRSVAAAVFALTLVWASGIAVAHPILAQPGPRSAAYRVNGLHASSRGARSTMDMDCARHGGLAVLHLFCQHDSRRCPLR